MIVKKLTLENLKGVAGRFTGPYGQQLLNGIHAERGAGFRPKQLRRNGGENL